jgi:hypothetical protein
MRRALTLLVWAVSSLARGDATVPAQPASAPRVAAFFEVAGRDLIPVACVSNGKWLERFACNDIVPVGATLAFFDAPERPSRAADVLTVVEQSRRFAGREVDPVPVLRVTRSRSEAGWAVWPETAGRSVRLFRGGGSATWSEDLDGDGRPEHIRTGPTVTISGEGMPMLLARRGALVATLDFDGDGARELVVRDTRYCYLWTLAPEPKPRGMFICR